MKHNDIMKDTLEQAMPSQGARTVIAMLLVSLAVFLLASAIWTLAT
ncbi:MAG: hypothetical protein O7H39_16020 [Gammaproteobacteria bacterium]|nr:hypothetical protein [Gammaproteobacteria bacterium]